MSAEMQNHRATSACITRDKVNMRLLRYISMFVGFGTLSGGAHAIGQRADRTSFQLVSGEKFSYRARQWRAGGELLGGRKQTDGTLVHPDQTRNDFEG